MPSSTYSQIWKAVRAPQAIAFNYDDKPRKAALIVLGYSKDGKEAMIAYQTGGETSPDNRLPGWRCFYLSRIRDVSFSNGEWLRRR